MANLIVKVGDVVSYSEGVYLPEENVQQDAENRNRIIKIETSSEDKIVVFNAASDVTDYDYFIGLDNNEDIQECYSSYIVVSDSDWVTVSRDRNIISLIIEKNHDQFTRVANVQISHNAVKDVYCSILIRQDGEMYTLTVKDENDNTIDENNPLNFGIDAEVKNLNVTCSGGSGEYVIHKIRKYTIYTYGDETSEDTFKITKLTDFDGAISAFADESDKAKLKIVSNGSLIVDDSYYEIILEHKDLIGLKAKIIVKYPIYIPMDGLPEYSGETDDKCEMTTKLPVKPTQIKTPHPTPSISSDASEITVNSSDYCDELTVITTPEESKIYFTYYGTFIDDYVITDYMEANGTITHGLKIKAKPNPFGVSRKCVGYVINAMYPRIRAKIIIKQGPNT